MNIEDVKIYRSGDGALGLVQDGETPLDVDIAAPPEQILLLGFNNRREARIWLDGFEYATPGDDATCFWWVLSDDLTVVLVAGLGWDWGGEMIRRTDMRGDF